MSTNVQNLRDLSRWNLFEFDGNKYVSVFPFAGTCQEMCSFRKSLLLARVRESWPRACGSFVVVILPYGCCF